MARVLFATSSGYPHLTADDRLAAAALERLGIDVAPAIWNYAMPDQLKADAIVIRSCWDYHLNLEEFTGWLAAVQEAGIPTLNPVRLLHWNLHKRYLLDLAAWGVKIIPTILLDGRPSSSTLVSLVEEKGWPEVVLKPAVSLSAYRTRRVSSHDISGEVLLSELRASGDVLIQPYIPEITTSGEWSLVFIDGSYSHAVRKLPKPGDFRVQIEHGGTAESAIPPSVVFEAAVRAISCLREAPPYARVDGIVVGEDFLLVELECIDPVLYFECYPAAADVFAGMVLKRLHKPLIDHREEAHASIRGELTTPAPG